MVRAALAGVAFGLALLASACGRPGGVAGHGASCDEQHPCRTGYACEDRRCRPEASPADASGELPEAGLPGAELPFGRDATSADTPDAGPSPADAGAPAVFPSLTRCREYRHWEQQVGCAAGPDAGASVIQSVAFSPDGRTLVSADDTRLKFWTIDGPTLTPSGTEIAADVEEIVFSPDGTLLAGMGSQLHVWRVATGTRELLHPSKPYDYRGAYGFVQFGADGDHLVIAGEGIPLQVLSVSKKAVQREMPVDLFMWADASRARRPAGGAWWMAVSTGVTRNYATVSLVDLNAITLGLTEHFQLRVANGLARVAWSPDGDTLAVAAHEGAHLWNMRAKAMPMRAGVSLRGAEAAEDYVSGMEFSPSGAHVAIGVGEWPPRGNLSIHSVETGKIVASRDIPQQPRRPRYSPDGRALAAGYRLCAMFIYCRD